MEQKEKPLPVQVNGNYKNLNLKKKYERDDQLNLVIKDGQKVLKEDGLDDHEYIIVKKMFAEGKGVESKFAKYRYNNGKKEEYYPQNYICKVEYNDGDEDHEVSFWLNEDEHKRFAKVGGIDDKIKIVNLKETYINKKTGDEAKKDRLEFVKVD